jgi:hypothetical protein
VITRSSGSQRGARFLDPSRGAHLLKKAEGALNEDPVFLPVITLPKAPVGQQCLRQLGPRLDLVQYFKTAPEGGVRLGAVAQSPVYLAENTMNHALFKPEPPLLGNLQRHVGRAQSLAGVARGKVELRARAIRATSTPRGFMFTGEGGASEFTPIENSPRIIYFSASG